jgi:hypothetical protein
LERALRWFRKIMRLKGFFAGFFASVFAAGIGAEDFNSARFEARVRGASETTQKALSKRKLRRALGGGVLRQSAVARDHSRGSHISAREITARSEHHERPCETLIAK